MKEVSNFDDVFGWKYDRAKMWFKEIHAKFCQEMGRERKWYVHSGKACNIFAVMRMLSHVIAIGGSISRGKIFAVFKDHTITLFTLLWRPKNFPLFSYWDVRFLSCCIRAFPSLYLLLALLSMPGTLAWRGTLAAELLLSSRTVKCIASSTWI